MKLLYVQNLHVYKHLVLIRGDEFHALKVPSAHFASLSFA